MACNGYSTVSPTTATAIHPLPVTDKELNFYCSGKAVHEAVQRLLMADPGRFEKVALREASIYTTKRKIHLSNSRRAQKLNIMLLNPSRCRTHSMMILLTTTNS